MKYTHLPHVDLKGHYQFITFRTKESLDSYLKKLHALDVPVKQKRYLIDRYLDSGASGSLIDAATARKIIAYYRDKEGTDFELLAVSMMPNHVHVLLKQKTDLPKIIQTLKGGAAHIINTTLNRSGKVWSRDYFDKLIRDEKHFSLTYDYIRNNAQKAGLSDAAERFYGVYG